MKDSYDRKMSNFSNVISVQNNFTKALFLFFNQMSRPIQKPSFIGDKLFMEHVSNGLPVLNEFYFKLFFVLWKKANFKAWIAASRYDLKNIFVVHLGLPVAT